MDVFTDLESEVRSYSRAWPTVFRTARGCIIEAEDGRKYLDFFAGAGALNYGHNHPLLKERLLGYLAGDGIIHGLDMATTAKREFIERFDELILRPRGMQYKFQFPGPTGTNAVEAALKLARKVTGRGTILCFTNAFHGMTLGSLAVSANGRKRRAAGVTLPDVVRMPFDGYLGEADSIDHIERLLADGGSGVELPAAVIVETVQAEGGINVASAGWLRRLSGVCRRHGMLLIVDDIQVGCGRTGPFFSFEGMGVEPDIICLSKSLSGFGLPMALTLLRPEIDVWAPGEHNGTFRGNNAAFVTATAALELYWADGRLASEVTAKAECLGAGLQALADSSGGLFTGVRGRGLIRGLRAAVPAAAKAVTAEAFARGLLVETAGFDDDVVKLLPPLVIDDDDLDRGLRVLGEATAAVAATF